MCVLKMQESMHSTFHESLYRQEHSTVRSGMHHIADCWINLLGYVGQSMEMRSQTLARNLHIVISQFGKMPMSFERGYASKAS
ncbi:hypothetical protein OSTOST_00033 [Ostertagia ostertagi]